MKLVLQNKSISIYLPKTQTIVDADLIDRSYTWTVLFFYPADFSIVCPTELQRLQEYKEELESYGVRILVISRDSHYTHQQWVASDKHLQGFDVTMVSDRDAEIGKELCFSVVDEESKNHERITMILDKGGNVLSIELYPNNVGRNIDELVRKIKAMKYVSGHPNDLCPENWNKHNEPLHDTIQKKGNKKIFISNT